MMKKFGLFLLVSVMLASMLAGCGSNSQQEVLRVYNVAEYIDMSVLKDFEKETGIKVIYDTFVTNEDMYTKISSSNETYDVVVPSDYMISRMIDEDMLQKIDYSKISNFSNINDSYKNLEYDPTNEYSVPYMTGTLGIIYNKDFIKEEIDSWSAMWDEKYSDNIIMLDSTRDALCVALKYLGYSANTESDSELEEAKQMLIKQKPLVHAYLGDEILDSMIGGEVGMAVTYSGIAYNAIAECSEYNLDYVIPKEGSNKWVDAMVILKSAQNVDAAHKFIDFLCREDIAAKNTEYIQYTSPLKTVKELLPEEMKNSPVLYPDDNILDLCETFVYNKDTVKKYNDAWEAVVMASK